MDKPHQDKPPKMPTETYNYHHKLVNSWRTDLKPLNVDQPEGPSFQVPLYVLATTSLQTLPVVLFLSICQSEYIYSILAVVSTMSFCWVLACRCHVRQTQITAKTGSCKENYLRLYTAQSGERHGVSA